MINFSLLSLSWICRVNKLNSSTITKRKKNAFTQGATSEHDCVLQRIWIRAQIKGALTQKKISLIFAWTEGISFYVFLQMWPSKISGCVLFLRAFSFAWTRPYINLAFVVPQPHVGLLYSYKKKENITAPFSYSYLAFNINFSINVR